MTVTATVYVPVPNPWARETRLWIVNVSIRFEAAVLEALVNGWLAPDPDDVNAYSVTDPLVPLGPLNAGAEKLSVGGMPAATIVSVAGAPPTPSCEPSLTPSDDSPIVPGVGIERIQELTTMPASLISAATTGADIIRIDDTAQSMRGRMTITFRCEPLFAWPGEGVISPQLGRKT